MVKLNKKENYQKKNNLISIKDQKVFKMKNNLVLEYFIYSNLF